MSRTFNYASLLATVLLASALGGCGSDSRESGTSPASVNRVSEGSCATSGCHSDGLSSITGLNIYNQYLASRHFINNGSTVGCQDCHGGGALHNGVGPLPYPNPDASGRCFSCHQASLPTAHYYAMTTGAGTQPAMYASLNYQTTCTGCHDSHNPAPGTRHADWAASGHGDVNGPGWANRDFKNYDTTGACVPCHTSTGFINFVNAGYVMPTVTWGSPTDFTREVLTCRACHTNYNFGERVRSLNAVKAIYTYGGSAITFTSVGNSNLCVVCHSGRGNTEAARSSRFQGHHAPAAAILFSAKTHIGYEFATKSYTDSLAFAHDKIGTTAYPNINAIDRSNVGPCVACHMVTSVNTHSFKAVTKNASGAIVTAPTAAVCTDCHVGMNAAALEALRRGYIDAGQYLNDLVANTVTNYLGAAVKTATADASSATYYTTVAANAYGAFQNAKITTEELGGYVHNSKYVKRLIFDSIDWMDNGAFDGTITIPAGYPDARVWFGAVAGVAARP